jgi:colanic acid/amylovoran biosynthesis glycosyltransferase
MTVAYILKTWPRLSQTFIVNEILAHERAGLAVEIHALRRPKAEDAHADVSRVRAPVHYVDATGPEAIDRLVAQLSRPRAAGCGPVRHLHAHFGNSAAEAARLAAQRLQLPWSFTAHARDIFHESVDTEALGRRMRAATTVVTVSDFNLRHLRETFPDCGERVVRIYNGLDLSRLRQRPASSTRAPLLLAVGRLVEKKGFEDLVQACALLEALRLPLDWRCAIVGSGPLQGVLEERIDALGLGHRVAMLGAQPQQDVLDLMREATLLAAPCTVSADGDRDGLPTVLLEAMALGCPVVTTAVTGIPELVQDGDTGRLLPPGDPQALAGALRDLLLDPAAAARLAGSARARIERDFDIARNTRALRQVFGTAGPQPAAAARVPLTVEG